MEMLDARKTHSIRTWLAFAAIGMAVAAALVWGGMRLIQARQQAAAIAVIEQQGGEVYFDFQRSNPAVYNVYDPKRPLPAPQLLRTLVGDDPFRTVVSVAIRQERLRELDLEFLESLPQLNALSLKNVRITPEAAVKLQTLKGLRHLSLWKCDITDESLQHLSELTKLESLVLDGNPKISDAGLVHLEGLVNLEDWLGLTETSISDAGLAHLQRLAKLRNLNLRKTDVTRSGARSLQTHLPHAQISDGQ